MAPEVLFALENDKILTKNVKNIQENNFNTYNNNST